MKHRSTKHYGHDLGLSACFRQWRATHSHCSLLHGYALAFTFIFEADTLDERNWVVDFGALDPLKKLLKETFDHKTLVAGDDPQIDELSALSGIGLADVVVFPDGVGCEKFAQWGHKAATSIIDAMGLRPRVRVVSCEVREHGANSAIYIEE